MLYDSKCSTRSSSADETSFEDTAFAPGLARGEECGCTSSSDETRSIGAAWFAWFDLDSASADFRFLDEAEAATVVEETAVAAAAVAVGDGAEVGVGLGSAGRRRIGRHLCRVLVRASLATGSSGDVPNVMV